MTELSLEERDALLDLAACDAHAVFDRRTLTSLRARGLATFSDDGWELTDLGSATIRRTFDA